MRLDTRFLAAGGRHAQPALVHGYAATAHIMQGQTAERAFVLGSESIYREWGYVAMTRARERTMFYVCDSDAAPNLAAAALERSRAQTTAHELAEQAAVAGLSNRELAGERARLEQVIASNPADAERRAIAQLESSLEAALGELNHAVGRFRIHGSNRTRLRRRPRDPEALALAGADQQRAQARVASLTEELHELRASGTAARWLGRHRDDVTRHQAEAGWGSRTP